MHINTQYLAQRSVNDHCDFNYIVTITAVITTTIIIIISTLNLVYSSLHHFKDDCQILFQSNSVI